ncbi:MAG: hypothetical protein D6766_00015 [Verrucomicrobia bacterium]|nr:MAG: hypothetical protein D6766_00015 [Verrucomicrobiota bacterium]
MEPKILFKFVEEVRRESRLARMAHSELRAAVAALDPNRAAVFVTAVLTHTIAVSRLLWPERPESAERGATLRRELQITEPSPLQLAGFRKHLARPDETYEDWLQRLPQPNYLEFNLMPAALMAGAQNDTFQGHLDPDTLEYTFRGDKAALAPVDGALRKLESACDYWLRTHNPW